MKIKKVAEGIASVALAAVMAATAGCSGGTTGGGGTGGDPTQPIDSKTVLERAQSFETKVIGTANIAPQGYAMTSSSSREDGYSNLHINDGDPSTGYSSIWNENTDTAHEYYIFINLTEVRNLTKVVIKPLAGEESAMPKSVEILVSDDGSNYTTVGTGSYTSGDITVDITGSSGKYVKMITKELAENSEKGCYFAIGEMEVYAEVSNDNNMVIDKDDLWLYCTGTPTLQQITVSEYLVDNGDNEKTALSYASADESIATVSADGVITPVAPGDTEIYVLTDNNLAKINVRVLEDDPYAYRTTVFYHSSFGYPDVIESCLDYIKGCGIDYIEDTRCFDLYGNIISEYMVYLCSERGLFYSANDEAGDYKFLEMTDEEIINIVKKYENRAGFYGIYLQDEPHAEWLQYAHVANVITTYNEHVTPHLNLLPPYNFGGASTYFNDYIAVANTSKGLGRYLSYDHYLYPMSGSNSQVYESLNMMRKAGLWANTATGYYIQAMGIEGAHREPDADEIMLNASLGVAYGMKNFKYFVGLTPISVSGESYTSGIIGPDYQPSDMYEGITNANAMIKSVEKTLKYAKAIEVYSTNTLTGNTKVPSNFVFTAAAKQNAIYTLYETNDGSQQYIVVTNNSYAGKAKTFSINVAEDVSELWLVEDGVETPLTIDADHKISITLDPGTLAIIKLPAGYDAALDRVDRSENLALECGVTVSTVAADFWSKTQISTIYATDGTIGKGGWLSNADDTAARITVDLGSVKSITSVSIYGSTSFDLSLAPSSYTILVSEDGETYKEVANVTGASYANVNTPSTSTFDAVNARYVKIQSNTGAQTGIGEIEIR